MKLLGILGILATSGLFGVWLSKPSAFFKEQSPPGVLELAIAKRHSCLIYADHRRLACYGHNDFGQSLGANPTGQIFQTPTPVLTADQKPLDHVTQVSLGEDFTCVLQQNEQVSCFGKTAGGRLGHRPLKGPSSPPKLVQKADGQPLAGVSALASGTNHSCAIVADAFGADHDGIFCWGSNEYGQLGLASKKIQASEVARPIPLTQSYQTTWRHIASGDHHSCALSRSDELYCWGRGDHGQLGLSTLAHGFQPQKVPLPTENLIEKLALGSNHSCALTHEGELYCFGKNHHGQLAAAPHPRFIFRPHRLFAKTSFVFTDIAAGGNQTCGTTEKQTLCFGEHHQGVSEYSLAFLHGLSAGGGQGCGLLKGAAYCVGKLGFQSHEQDGGLVTKPTLLPVAGLWEGQK